MQQQAVELAQLVSVFKTGAQAAGAQAVAAPVRRVALAVR
jgi:hypothetical protein